MGETFLWYDLETFGTHRALDRIAQFAAIRTDSELRQIEEPVVLYSKITVDYVPDPMSCLITGITPKTTLEKGLPELEFVERIFRELSRPGTCVVGYNNLSFDDEFLRNAFYRNLFDPFYREWAGGNSRWDIINLARAARDLRPEGLEWPINEKGKPSFKLEDLTRANGISHEDAHDALADVRATIEIARRIREAQPKLFDYLYQHRKKEKVKEKIDLHTKPLLLHSSEHFTRPEGCTAPVLPLAGDPQNHNAVVCFDLRADPSQVIDLSVEEIRKRLFTPNEQLPEGSKRIPLIKIQANKAPVISPPSVLDSHGAQRLGLDLKESERKAERLRKTPSVTQKLMEVYNTGGTPHRRDPELEIYHGFIPDSDRDKMEGIRGESPQTMLDRRFDFDDPRLPPLVWRLVCRNYPESLDETTEREWRNFCAGRLLFPPERMINDYHFFTRKIVEYSESREIGPKDKLVLRELQEWADTVKREVLSYS